MSLQIASCVAILLCSLLPCSQYIAPGTVYRPFPVKPSHSRGTATGLKNTNGLCDLKHVVSKGLANWREADLCKLVH